MDKNKTGVYKYLHTNGTIITKPAMVVDYGGGPYEYFDSPFVQKWWYEEVDEKKDETVTLI